MSHSGFVVIPWATRGHNKPPRGTHHVSHPGQVQGTARKLANRKLRQLNDEAVARMRGVTVDQLREQRFREVEPSLAKETRVTAVKIGNVISKDVSQNATSFHCECGHVVDLNGSGIYPCRRCGAQYAIRYARFMIAGAGRR